MRTCHSGAISFAVTNTRCHFAGTSGKSTRPSLAMRSISSSEYQPSFFAIATKSSFTSGIITPAWLRMNATAKSGSRPDEQPAMIEIVPVGATVVTLQLRSSCIGRMRFPSASRAHVSSGPQIDRAHSGNAPRSFGEPLALLLGLDVHELHDLAAELDAFVRVVRDAEPNERVGEAHDAKADAADALGQRVDLRQRVLVDVDDVVEEVRRERDVAARTRPSPSARR